MVSATLRVSVLDFSVALTSCLLCVREINVFGSLTV